MSNHPELLEIYDYLSDPLAPTEADPAIVFGRNDERVAHAAGDLIASGLVTAAVITGGVGKDTGDLLERGYQSEAHYLDVKLGEYLRSKNTNWPPIYLDEKARHGGENASNSLDILNERGYPIESTIAVVHATSLRRLAETVRHHAMQRGVADPQVFRVPTRYGFDPANPIDRDEAVAELLRLADWPAQGLLPEQQDLPAHLVDFARDIQQAKK